MKIRLAYSHSGLEVNLPDDLKIDVVRAKPDPAINNPHLSLIEAIKKPLMTKSLPELLKKRPPGKICVVVSDHTRPVPSKIILEALVTIFDELKIPDSDVQILIGTGLHRKSNPQEIKSIVGQNIIARYDIINHVAANENEQEYLGQNSRGNPVYIDKVYINAAFKIITGYVEPHFFAGFSGGRKGIVPGIAGSITIQGNHSAKNIDSSFTRFGVLEKNPIYEDGLEIAKMTKIRPDFMINVCINPQHQITKIVAGSLQAYGELVKYQENLCFHKINELYDVVIANNGGSPLDLNLYQAVKSMAIGELGVKKGGTIISVNECKDMVGQEKFEELINCGLKPDILYNKIVAGEIKCPDQWEIQILARVLNYAEIYVVSTIPANKLGNIGLKYAESVEQALNICRNKYGSKMRVLVLPDGPSILPKYEK